jgi:23S rRNA (pseudouridine1915-N3)-methyltransferase
VSRLLIAAVGDRLPAWASEACTEYLRRMPRGYEVHVFEVKAEARRGGRTPQQMMAAEAQRLRDVLPRGTRMVAMDERGKDLTTAAFSTCVRNWLDSGVPTAFLLGGPDGLDAALKRDCNASLRLSAMTLPHAMARAILAEQLYRAATLLTGHPYHRE